MSIGKQDLLEFINQFEDDAEFFIGEGGLTLCGKRTDENMIVVNEGYIEIGGESDYDG